ncbi:MAG: transposase [Synergistaceae bacterium]
MDETKSRKGHRYVTVFIDLDQPDKPVVFAVAGKGKQTLKAFKTHLAEHGGKAEQIVEVVSDMSGAFIAGVKSHFSQQCPHGGLVPCGAVVYQGH